MLKINRRNTFAIATGAAFAAFTGTASAAHSPSELDGLISRHAALRADSAKTSAAYNAKQMAFYSWADGLPINKRFFRESLGTNDIDLTCGSEIGLAIIDERFSRVPEYAANVKGRFLRAYAAIAETMSALNYDAEDKADEIAYELTFTARLAVLALRPVNDTERATKAAWLFSEFGGEMKRLDEGESAALLSSLYPVAV